MTGPDTCVAGARVTAGGGMGWAGIRCVGKGGGEAIPKKPLCHKIFETRANRG